jgi:hypothetical protein
MKEQYNLSIPNNAQALPACRQIVHRIPFFLAELLASGVRTTTGRSARIFFQDSGA